MAENSDAELPQPESSATSGGVAVSATTRAGSARNSPAASSTAWSTTAFLS